MTPPSSIRPRTLTRSVWIDEEIEFEIDQEPAAVLTSMDEDVETKNTRSLEEKLDSFEQVSRLGTNDAPRAYITQHSYAYSRSDENSAITVLRSSPSHYVHVVVIL